MKTLGKMILIVTYLIVTITALWLWNGLLADFDLRPDERLNLIAVSILAVSILFIKILDMIGLKKLILSRICGIFGIISLTICVLAVVYFELSTLAKQPFDNTQLFVFAALTGVTFLIYSIKLESR
ncbi:MAG: hypothetical protein WC146_00520 [Patescibacteria group bacterium]|jgi:cbb3-type cytochrome oxidase subunit 3